MQVDSIWQMLRLPVARLLRPGSPRAARHLSFAALFAISVVAGRLTTAPDTGVAMVWPAAGVALVWFLTAMESEGTAWGNASTVVTAAIFAITAPLNIMSGMSPARAVVFAIGNAAAGFLGAWVYRVLRPREGVALGRLLDVGPLIAAAVASGVGGAMWGPLFAVGWDGGPVALVWQALTRNAIGTLVFGACLLRILSGTPLAPAPPWRRLAGLVVLSVGAYWVTMVPYAHQPLSFVLTCVTVAAAVVLTVDGLMVFILCAGSVILWASFVGFGPFALTGTDEEVFTAQAYIGAQTVIGLVLTLAREDLALLIHQLRDARGRAERQSELVGRVIGAMSEAVVAVDGGTVVLSNDAAHRMFGLTPGMSVAGTPLSSREEDSDRPLDRALAGQAVAQDVAADIDGDRRVVSVWAHPLGRDTGHAVAVVRDVTDHRRQLADLSSFASVLAHDLLNPIGAVEGWLEVIDEETDPAMSPVIAKATGRAGQSARRLREIVTGLHAYSVARGGELSLNEIDLQVLSERLVGGRVAAAENTEGAVVPVCTVDARQVVMGDESLVAQVIDNLVGNAVKYSAPGSTPHITVSAEAPVAGIVTVRVDDDGIGIPETDRDKVFEEFHRVGRDSKAYAGTGLGLSICRRMIERHGGTIRAAESPQGGTRMEFTLPAACRGGVTEGPEAAAAENRAALVQGRSAQEAAHEARRRITSRTSAG